MKLLAIEELNPGMVLAKDVLSPEGRLLLRRGFGLTEKGYRIFNIWGVCEAWVEDGGDDLTEEPAAAVDAQVSAAAAALIDDAFTEPSGVTTADQSIRQIFHHCAMDDMAQLGIENVLKRYRAPAPLQEEVRGTGQNGTMDEILAGEIPLAVLPNTVLQLFDTMGGQYSFSAVAEIISRDVSLSAKILQIVNSSFYGFPRRIDSMSRAVTIIGERELQNIAIGISLIRMFKEFRFADFDEQSFWRHSIGCGILCKCLGEQLTGVNHEQLFLSGLLHDIGRLVVLQTRPHMVVEAIYAAKLEKTPLYLMERKLWGFDHSELGGRLLERWNFPPSIADSVRYHHDYRDDSAEAGLVHLANILAQSAAMGNGGLYQVSPVHPDVWDMYAIPGNVLRSVVIQARNQEKTLLNILL